MRKKISLTSLLFLSISIALMISQLAFAERFSYTGEYQVMVSHARFAQPFQVGIDGAFGSPSVSVSLDYTLSSGITLLNGDLHWRSHPDSNGIVHQLLLVQIDKPGRQEISVVVNASIKPQLFPRYDTLFFYAREDTVVQFVRRAEMEQAIRDSLVYPGVATRRYYERHQVTAKANQEKRDRELARLHDTTNFLIKPILVADTIPDYQLSDHFSPDQIQLIKHYHLYYSPPRLDCLETSLQSHYQSEYPPDKLDTMIVAEKRYYNALYEFDQRLLTSVSSDSVNQLLGERNTLILRLAKATNASINSSK